MIVGRYNAVDAPWVIAMDREYVCTTPFTVAQCRMALDRLIGLDVGAIRIVFQVAINTACPVDWVAERITSMGELFFYLPTLPEQRAALARLEGELNRRGTESAD